MNTVHTDTGEIQDYIDLKSEKQVMEHTHTCVVSIYIQFRHTV